MHGLKLVDARLTRYSLCDAFSNQHLMLIISSTNYHRSSHSSNSQPIKSMRRLRTVNEGHTNNFSSKMLGQDHSSPLLPHMEHQISHTQPIGSTSQQADRGI